jgi:hypothetical protein
LVLVDVQLVLVALLVVVSTKVVVVLVALVRLDLVWEGYLILRRLLRLFGVDMLGIHQKGLLVLFLGCLIHVLLVLIICQLLVDVRVIGLKVLDQRMVLQCGGDR